MRLIAVLVLVVCPAYGQEIRLAMYRKRAGAPAPGAAALPILLLVHGSSPAALSSFDLAVPGRRFLLAE